MVELEALSTSEPVDTASVGKILPPTGLKLRETLAMLTAADDLFHQPRYRDFTWTETRWWSFIVPEENRLGWIYLVFRLNIGSMVSQVAIWSKCFKNFTTRDGAWGPRPETEHPPTTYVEGHFGPHFGLHVMCRMASPATEGQLFEGYIFEDGGVYPRKSGTAEYEPDRNSARRIVYRLTDRRYTKRAAELAYRRCQPN